MAYIQNSFLFGERRTNQVTGRDYYNSVYELKNFYVEKSGAIKRRGGLSPVLKFMGSEGEGIKQILPLSWLPPGKTAPEDIFFILYNNGKVKVKVREEEEGFDLEFRLHTYREYNINSGIGESRALQDFNIEINSTYLIKEIRKVLGGIYLIPDKEEEKVEGADLKKGGLPFRAYIDGESLILTYLGLKKSGLKTMKSLVRAFPIDPRPVEFKDLIFNSGGRKNFNRIPELIIGAEAIIEAPFNLGRAWLGGSDLDKAVAAGLDPKVDASKMALKDWIGKPLYFSVLPDNLTRLRVIKTPADGDTAAVNYSYNTADDYNYNLALKNLNANGGDLANFSYLEEGTSLEQKRGLIRELLYGRQYMIIPRAMKFHSSLTKDQKTGKEKVSFSTLYPSARVIAPAKNTAQLGFGVLARVDGDTEFQATGIQFVPEDISAGSDDVTRGPDAFIRGLRLNTALSDNLRGDYNHFEAQFVLTKGSFNSIRPSSRQTTLYGGSNIRSNLTSSNGLFVNSTLNSNRDIESIEFLVEADIRGSSERYKGLEMRLYINFASDSKILSDLRKANPSISDYSVRFPEDSVNPTHIYGLSSASLSGRLYLRLDRLDSSWGGGRVAPRYSDGRLYGYTSSELPEVTYNAYKAELCAPFKADSLLGVLNAANKMLDSVDDTSRVSRQDELVFSGRLLVWLRNWINRNNKSIGAIKVSVSGFEFPLPNAAAAIYGFNFATPPTSDAKYKQTTNFSGSHYQKIVFDPIPGNPLAPPTRRVDKESQFYISAQDGNAAAETSHKVVTGISVLGFRSSDHQFGIRLLSESLNKPPFFDTIKSAMARIILKAGNTLIRNFDRPEVSADREDQGRWTLTLWSRHNDYSYFDRGEVSAVYVEFFSDSAFTNKITYEVVIANPPKIDVAEGYNSISGGEYIVELNPQDPNVDKVAQFGSARGSLENDELGIIKAVGFKRHRDKKWGYFLQIERTENAIEAQSEVKLHIGSIQKTLSKRNIDLGGVIEYNEDNRVATKPTTPTADQVLKIDLNPSGTERLYEFESAKLANRIAKAWARCNIYEIGMPSPITRDGLDANGNPAKIRMIGGNNFDRRENVASGVVASVDLKFNDISSIKRDLVLANKDRLCISYDEDGGNNFLANNPYQAIGAVLEKERSITELTGYSPYREDIERGVFFSYFNKSGDNLSSVLEGPQGDLIRDYVARSSDSALDSRGRLIATPYINELNDLKGRDASIRNIAATFNGAGVFVFSDSGLYISPFAQSGPMRFISDQISKFSPIVFLNKVVNFNTNGLFVSQIASEERRGDVERFSGSYQTHLLNEKGNSILDIQYWPKKNLYFLLRSSGDLVTALDLDENIEGYSRWDFSKGCAENANIDIKIKHIWIKDDTLFCFAKYETEAGVFKIDLDRADDQLFDGPPQRFESYLKSQMYVDTNLGPLALVYLWKLNKVWVNADGNPSGLMFGYSPWRGLYRGPNGVAVSEDTSCLKWYSVGKKDEARGYECFAEPMNLRCEYLYHIQSCLRIEEPNTNLTLHGLTIAGSPIPGCPPERLR